MERRSFLSLLIAAPVAAKLAPLAEPAPVLEAVTEIARSLTAMRMALTFSTAAPVATGRVELCEIAVQHLFRADRLMVPHAVEDFQILNVSAAGEPVLDEFMDASLFSPASFGTHMQFAPVHPGQRIVMAVRNLAAPRVFSAAFMGTVLVPRAELSYEDQVVDDDDFDDDDFDDDDFDDDFDDMLDVENLEQLGKPRAPKS